MPALRASALRLQQNFVPRSTALARGNRNAAGQIDEIGRLREQRSRTLDPEVQLVSFVEIERFAHTRGDPDLSLGWQLGPDARVVFYGVTPQRGRRRS